MKRTFAVYLLLTMFVAGVLVVQAQQRQSVPTPAGLDTAAIDRIIGRTGATLAGDVRIGFPRTDLTVTVGGVKVLPGLALGSWAAFKATSHGAVVHGDLVLLDPELNPVISALQTHDFEITAVHNHLLNETPAIVYALLGQGSATALAQG
jgi:hypothetical protein